MHPPRHTLRHPLGQPEQAAAGLTLLELLLVMAILGTVFGVGLGMFAALDVEQRQAAGVVKEALRTARNSALTRQAPASVRIDAAAGTLRPGRLMVIGTWAFEPGTDPELVEGAFGLNGRADGARWVEDGWIGNALDLSEQGTVEVPVDDDPAWDLCDGFAIELAVHRTDTGGGRLLRIGDTLRVEVGAGGEVRAWFVAADTSAGASSRPGGRIQLEAPAGTVPPGQWVRLRYAYDGRRVELVADRVPRARMDCDEAVWELDGPLILSDDDRPFPGAVDSLVVGAVVVDEELALPETVRLAVSPPEVCFTADGSLDRAVHEGPVRLQLAFEDDRTETITVGVYGTIE